MPDIDTAALLEAAESIVHEAAALAMAYFRCGVSVHNKADASPVTTADRETETAIREAIASRFPDHGILGEEYGDSDPEREYVWVVDPIDGTKSFIAGAPLFGSLIGVMERTVPVAGVIHMPALGETFSGAPSLGSRLNGKPIQCRRGVAPHEAYICLNELHKLIRHEPERTARLLTTGRYQRPTIDCYPYAQLAAGWVDGVVDFDLDPYDYLPLVGVVQGAGGIISDWQGRPLGPESDGTVAAAASPAIHDTLLEALTQVTGCAG